MKFPEFNRIVNPNDDKCYVAKTLAGISKGLTFKEIAKLGSQEANLEIQWIIPKGFLVIITKQLNILPIIIGRKEPLFVIQNNNELYIISKCTKFDRTTDNNILMCGISANTLAFNRSGNKILLPFKHRINTNPIYNNIEIKHSNGIDTLPNWLFPIYRNSKTNTEGSIEIPIQNNTRNTLYNHFTRLHKFPKDVQLDVIKIINNDFCITPLPEKDLNTLISANEDEFVEQFMSQGVFLHNKLGDYVIDACNIKRDKEENLFYFNDKSGVYIKDDAFLLSYITRLCPTLKDFQKQETLKYIKNYLYEESVDFNSNPYVIVFKNGVLDIRNPKLEPFSPSHLESIQINCNYAKPTQSNKIVDEFFTTATCGDKDVEQLLYEAIGYAMLKTNELQIAFMLIGEGRNGKSTYLDLIKKILGRGNYTSVSFKDLQGNFRSSTLLNKLASFAADISNQAILDSELVKSIISGDDIMLEEKYKQPISKSLYSTMFYAGNALAKSCDTTEGFYRRFCIIPFNANLSAVSKVDGMCFKEKLLAPESLEYVAYKAVQAIIKVLDSTREFTEPQCVKIMKQNYRIENSSVLSWVKEMFKNDINELKKLKRIDAWTKYSYWCEMANRAKFSQSNFEQKLHIELGVVLQD